MPSLNPFPFGPPDSLKPKTYHSNIWCNLGEDLYFTLLRAPRTWTEKQAVEMAELSVIGHKPFLQNVGPKLDEISLEIDLEATYGDPAELMDALSDKRDKGEVLPLSLGNGAYLGDFVITDTEYQPRATFGDGTAFQAALKVTLREWIDDPDLQVSQRTKPAIRPTGTKKASPYDNYDKDPKTGHLVPKGTEATTPASKMKAH